jgi:PAS domain-containing protein
MNVRTIKPKESAAVITSRIIDKTQFPIVGIGASAGGLEAVEQFFGKMPKDCGMAFVVIQHSDGSLGLKAIKEKNGVVVVQDPATAKFDGMPRSAMEAVIADIVAPAEDLQSTNEELTTSKEEMQSLNEELQTVNVELQSKVADYIRANNDMKNLLNNIEIATIFLDKDLNIRRFTDPATKIFKLRDSDIGRPFTDQVSDLQYPDLENHAKKVIQSLAFCETAAPTNDGSWFNVRIMPYRTHNDFIDGLVMTFTDITELKKLESELKKNEINHPARIRRKGTLIPGRYS